MNNLVRHKYVITRKNRTKKNGHNSLVIWFTGLSGSGKSTIANLVEKKMFEENINTYSLDGDNIRTGLNRDLSFSEEDRHENLRRIAEVAKLFMDAGMVTIAAFISPLHRDRQSIRNIIGEENFIEVYVNTSLKTCEERDVKGLYKQARAGEIENFTGIDAPYEPPKDPDIEIRTEEEPLDIAVERIFETVIKKLKIYE